MTQPTGRSTRAERPRQPAIQPCQDHVQGGAAGDRQGQHRSPRTDFTPWI